MGARCRSFHSRASPPSLLGDSQQNSRTARGATAFGTGCFASISGHLRRLAIWSPNRDFGRQFYRLAWHVLGTEWVIVADGLADGSFYACLSAATKTAPDRADKYPERPLLCLQCDPVGGGIYRYVHSLHLPGRYTRTYSGSSSELCRLVAYGIWRHWLDRQLDRWNPGRSQSLTSYAVLHFVAWVRHGGNCAGSELFRLADCYIGILGHCLYRVVPDMPG